MKITNTGAEKLANAVVIHAARDYLDAKTKIKNNPDDKKIIKECEIELKSIKKFFRSQWYGLLTTIDGDEMIRRLDEAFENGQTTVDYILV